MRMSAGLAEVRSLSKWVHLGANYSSATDSRAVCNRIRPRCSRCAKSNRPCQYGLRLSWPKATNTKRSLTHSIQDVFGVAKSSSQTSFINATSWDIQLHDYLRMNQGLLTRGIYIYRSTNASVIGLGSYDGFVFQKLDPPMALSWLPINLGYEERELLDHCKYNDYLYIFFYQANTCSYMYGLFHTGHFRT